MGELCVKKVVALIAAILGACSAPASTPLYSIPQETIVFVDCGKWMGTAVKVGAEHYLTARHVTDSGKCSVNGVPIRNVKVNPLNDSATFDGPASPYVAGYSCKGTENWGKYLAMGYAEGRPFLDFEPMIASDIQSVE
jgi:hypothetical protein